MISFQSNLVANHFVRREARFFPFVLSYTKGSSTHGFGAICTVFEIVYPEEIQGAWRPTALRSKALEDGSFYVLSPTTCGMSAIGSAASSRLTPKTKARPLHLGSPGYTRQGREESDLHLTFKGVVGTTTSSANAFDADQETDSFVCCAGPAVILYQVNEHCEISQKLFRARENVLAINSSSSFYNPSTPPSTPNKTRHGTPLKDKGSGWGSSVPHEITSSPIAHTRANTRSREATCVSLSAGGQLLAVGEVIRLLYPGLSTLG